MMQSKPERSEGFDVIIRPAPEGAGRTTPEQSSHYSHYNTKFRDIFTEIRTAQLSLNRSRGHFVLGNPASIVTPSVLK